MKPIIEIKNLSAGYDDRTVLHDVNLDVYERDFLGIIGPNGGGKTTLIKCILGLLPLTGGEIIFHTPAEKASNTQLSLGYLPQYSTIDRKVPYLPIYARTERKRERNHRPHGARRS